MSYASNRPERRSIRLQDYDYTQAGIYFVTLCTYQRQCIFGEIENNGTMILNTIGCVISEEWERTPQVRPYVTLDDFIVMPNHLHGIIQIDGDATWVCHRQTPTNEPGGDMQPMMKSQYGQPIPKSLATILLQFKSVTTKRVNKLLGTKDYRVWQRNYYEHIIRDETALNNIRDYILNNPSNWAVDTDNPDKPPRQL